MKTSFAKLCTNDSGFIGSGIYVTLDLDYAFEEYGVGLYGLAEVPIIVCAVIVGNPLPVIECNRCDTHIGTDRDHYEGKAIAASAGAHIAVMGINPEFHGE